MENENESAHIAPSALIAVEQSRAIQEVQAAFIMAKKFPRDTNAVYSAIIESCKRPSLAKQAMYNYPRGKDEDGKKNMVSGPSIRMAEVLAQNYGNLDFGVRELERRDGYSVAEAYCLDLQTNTRQTKVFTVSHIRNTKKGSFKLKDERDIYELVANNGARRLRACVLSIIPGDFIDAAIKQCRQTIAKGNGEPLADRIRDMVVAFKEIGVSQEMLEQRLEHKVDLTTPEEIVDLTGIYTAIRDGQQKRTDFFDFPEDGSGSDDKGADIIAAVKAARAAAPEAPKPPEPEAPKKSRGMLADEIFGMWKKLPDPKPTLTAHVAETYKKRTDELTIEEMETLHKELEDKCKIKA